MKYATFYVGILMLASCVQAQSLEEQYNNFKRQAQNEYNDFRSKANLKYVEFIQEAWKQYKAYPAIPRPQDENVQPVVMPEEDKNRHPIENRPITIEDTVVVAPPKPKPQPVPLNPIKEQPKPKEAHICFVYLGTECEVRFNEDGKFSLTNCDNKTLASVWKRLSEQVYNNTVADCLKLRNRMRLCDWAYLNMLQVMAVAGLGEGNEAVLLAAFIYCQSGYKMRLGTVGNTLYLLYASEHTIYGQSYFEIDGEKFYPFQCEEEQIRVCQASFPKEQALSLQIQQLPHLTNNRTTDRMLTSKRYPDVTVQVNVNKNLLDFYGTYPSSEIGGNFMTRWAMYANVPLDTEVKELLYPTLRAKIEGLTELDATERLLNFVQTAFVYEYDDKIWGHDRAFFAEETLYYPYCDCEDRSILFSRLVRDLLGLKVILVYYPGHLATAVCFTEEVKGDRIMLDGMPYVVCDPTFIGAPVGYTMTGMDNRTAKIVLLE
ncbi:MAG: hypothetical protein K2J84_00075 [Bacteroidaceae bacterium]|nr:hypothetical protein [Bacteroidaceae bacterium]